MEERVVKLSELLSPRSIEIFDRYDAITASAILRLELTDEELDTIVPLNRILNSEQEYAMLYEHQYQGEDYNAYTS